MRIMKAIPSLLLLGFSITALQAHTLNSSDKEGLRQHILDEYLQKSAERSAVTPKAHAAPKPRRMQKPVQVASTGVLDLAALISISSFTAPSGNGSLMAASFGAFRPKVRFFWDGTTFYEESDNMPDNMPQRMYGITSWQQQIPLPAAYFANVTNPENNAGSLGFGQPNYWRLPLVPTVAASPTLIFTPGSTTNNFQRGAIALASNGVAIFNPANNTGRVSYEIGELDYYGGHCGMADDYHYHIIPMHLSSRFGGPLTDDLPVAWALDGYPIYGYVEPDGTTRQALDSNGGHDHGSWGYHYHAIGNNTVDATHPYGTPQSPYTMTSFRGTVVNFGGQVDGQPEITPMRASGTGGYTAQPVAGALFNANAYKNPVALTTDGSGHLVEDTSPSAVASSDNYRLRVTINGTDYDECWRLNRTANPRSMTVTWRLPGATTTTTYTSVNGRITAYPMAGASQAQIPDTSQTVNSTATFGEDADYTQNAQSLTDNGNGTITDNVTGLMWQKTDNGESTWETAITNASSLTLGGYKDWRLPTPSELFSIMNHNNANPALNTTYFPSNSPAAEYWWTSDFYGASTTNVWCANSGGGLGPKPKTETISAGGTLRYHARYVRGTKATNAHNYQNNGDGTITDLDTRLMWAQVPGASTTWDSAISYAEALTTGGFTDWRLPNVKELQTLTDYTLATYTSTSGIKPSLHRQLFPSATATAYWSSSSQNNNTANAWVVEFGINNATSPPRGAQGIISQDVKTASYPVFAVRSVPSGSITQGRGTTTTTNLFPPGQRVTAVGTITATDNSTWTVPAATLFATAPKAPDLYNDYTAVTPANLAARQAAIDALPTTVVDVDGEVVTGYIFSDNYFELYVNGVLVGVDPVSYTSFNSCVVKFKAKRPITYAVRLVDWEENLGLGTELNGGDPYHIGDGGFIASFSDGTVTNNQWKAQTFYIAPLDNPNQVVELADGTRSSASATHSLTETAYAMHYPLPAGWQSSSYSTTGWPNATTYTEAQVGVNFPAYMNFQPQFTGSGAQFIWSSSLTLDNEVIVRYTGPAATTTQIAVEQPTGSALTDGSSTVAYGSVNVGSTLSKTFTIRNTSSTTQLSITGVTIDGTNASNFTVTTAPASSIAASGSTTMVVQFNASTAGAKTAALHIASSDSSVGIAFDINLTGTGYIAPPVISNIRTSPNTPTYVDNVWVTAQIAASSGTTLSTAQLSYGNGTQSTSTVLAETMSNTATAGTNGWDGTGAAVPWTLTRAGVGDIKQSTAANHGSGNICGLEMGKGTAVATGTMAQTTNAINAAGSAGSVEFWVATSNLTAGLGWTFQTSTDNTTWTTRLSETSGTNHAHQLYHYDLTAAERVSTLRIRFQFIGNGTGGPTGPKAYFDDITISVTTGSPPTVVTMYDDGAHGDGLAADGVYGGAIPAQTAGTTITHSISATDANAGNTTSTAASYTVSAVTPPSNWSAAATVITGGNVTLTWPIQSGINYSVQWSDDLIHWNDIFLGATGSWTDTTAGGTTRRFYRISR
jgi:hypothetical protein